VNVVSVDRVVSKSRPGTPMIALNVSPTAKELSSVSDEYSVRCISLAALLTYHRPGSAVRIALHVGQRRCPVSSSRGATNLASNTWRAVAVSISHNWDWFFIQTDKGRSVRVLENRMSKIQDVPIMWQCAPADD